MTVFLHGLQVLAFTTIQFRALEQHFLDAARLRAVRILFSLTLCVMFTMDSSPFFSDLTSGQPQPETEKMTRNSVQFQCAMRLTTMEKNRYAGNRNMSNDCCEYKNLPACGTGNAIGKKIYCGFNKSAQNIMYSVVIACFVAYVV